MSNKTATILGTSFLLLIAAGLITVISYVLAERYFSEVKLTPEVTADKLEKIEDRLAKLKAQRGPNITIRMMSNEEKNELWWRIAQIANKSGSSGGSTKWNLTQAQATIVANEYGISVPNVFEFFKQNGSASWRTANPPWIKEEDRTFGSD